MASNLSAMNLNNPHLMKQLYKMYEGGRKEWPENATNEHVIVCLDPESFLRYLNIFMYGNRIIEKLEF